ncbi:alpha/beta hydrolase family protein [Aurantivibrio infirmus]
MFQKYSLPFLQLLLTVIIFSGCESNQEATRVDLPANQQQWARMDALFEEWKKGVPNGTGPYGVVREEPSTLDTHTVFKPAKATTEKLPIIAFANGGCRNTPIEFTAFLAEIVSHGYFVVAAGTIDVEFAVRDFSAMDKNGKPLQKVSRKVLTDAVDWAIRENARQGSPYYNKLDTNKIAYMGQSCGGMQALSASTDPRTTTTIVLNSGRFSGDRKPPAGGAFSEWFEWSELHAPIAYFLGGPPDGNSGRKNFEEINRLPVFLADLPVGHTGAYPDPDLRWSAAVLAWLDWQLKNNEDNKTMFSGENCGLCTNKDWTVTGFKNPN